jgi:hypothetical protein
MFVLFLILGGLLHATPTFAAGGASLACTLVGGCSAENNAPAILGSVADLLVAVVAAAAVVFVVWGGAQMLISGGDESKISQGRNSILYALGGFALALLSQTIISFTVGRANAASGGGNPFLAIATIAVDFMLVMFNITFTIVAMVAGLRLVLGRGKSEETDKARTMLLWAIIGGILINMSRPIVGAVVNLNF